MDPRVRAYQKQSRPAAPAASPGPAPFVPPPLPLPKAAPSPGLPAAFLKTTKDRSLRKVAKFLILLGQDEAAKVVRHLDPQQIEALSQEIAAIPSIEPIEAEQILQEFGYIAQTFSTEVRGGTAMAQSILDAAVGPEKAQTILHRVVPSAAPKPFAFLAEVDREVLKTLLQAESANVLSIVVPFLDKAQAAAFLKTLEPAQRLQLVKRLAKMEAVSKDILAKVETSLRERLHRIHPSTTEVVDGKTRLADILRHMSVDKEEAILRGLDQHRPELTEDLRRRLFTPEHLLRVHDADFEDLLRAKTDGQLALLWLAASADLRPKLEQNISSRRLLLVQAEADLLADTSPRELQKELRFFLEEVREAVRSGQAALFDDQEEYV